MLRSTSLRRPESSIEADGRVAHPTARTYKLPSCTITLIETLAHENGHARGEVLAACAGLLYEDVTEAKKEAMKKLERTLDSFVLLVTAPPPSVLSETVESLNCPKG